MRVACLSFVVLVCGCSCSPHSETELNEVGHETEFIEALNEADPPDQMTGEPWMAAVFGVAPRVQGDVKAVVDPEAADFLTFEFEYDRSHHDRVIGMTCEVTEIFKQKDAVEKILEIRYLRTASFDGEKIFTMPIYIEYGNELVLDRRKEPEIASVLEEWK